MEILPSPSYTKVAHLSLWVFLPMSTRASAAAAPRAVQTFDDHASTFQPQPVPTQAFSSHAFTNQPIVPSGTFEATFSTVTDYEAPTNVPSMAMASQSKNRLHTGALVSDAGSVASGAEAVVAEATSFFGAAFASASSKVAVRDISSSSTKSGPSTLTTKTADVKGPSPTAAANSIKGSGTQASSAAAPSSTREYVHFACGTEIQHASDHLLDTLHGLHTGQYPNGTAYDGHGAAPPSGASASSAPSTGSGGTWGGMYNPKSPNGIGRRSSHAEADRRARLSRRQSNSQIKVNAYMHVVTTAAHAGMVTQQQITQQVATLNSAYNARGVSFKLANSSFTTNDAWAVGGNDAADLAMKTALRQGTYADLNLYFQSDMAGGVLGQCTLPTNIGNNSAPSVYVRDGCNIAAGTVPGGPINGYNMGKTAVHETGHWLGLLHTFEGYNCTGNGDFVADTPAESTSTDGCPTTPWKNTCPGRQGLDPIHNYMDYSTDACYSRFTDGQQQRISTLWPQYRAGK